MVKTLAFDIDGVIADYLTGLLKHLNQHLGTTHTYEDCHDHNFAIALKLDIETMLAVVATYESEEVIARLPAINGSLESLVRLRQKYRIVAITSRKSKWQGATKRWFNYNFAIDDIYFAHGMANPFAGGEGRKTKQQIAEQIGALCLVEDNPNEFIHWNSSTVQPICFPQPWNQSLVSSHPDIPRLGWGQIVEKFLA